MRYGYVYIMTNKPYGTLYTGVTGNLHERVAQHREGRGSEFVKTYGLTRLVWWEQHGMIVSAIQRETSIKRWKRDWKIDLITKTNPKWLDLATSGGMP
jgi:putative endonuclease